MKFVFRLDFGHGIGWGHFSRCINIASALEARGHEIAFVSRSDPASHRAVKDFVPNKSVKIFSLPFDNSKVGPDTSSNLEMDEEIDDALDTVKISKKLGADCIVLDRYGFGRTWVEIVRSNFEVCAIADYPVNFAVDTVIDYGFDASIEKHSPAVAAGAKLIAGPVFAPIGDSYGRFSQVPADEPNEVGRVLVSLGGMADPKLAHKVINGISKVLPNANIHVAGDHKNLTGSSPQVHGKRLTSTREPGLAKEFEKADLAIVGGGVTMYELISSGCPGVVVQTADNQDFALSSATQVEHVKILKDTTESGVAENIANVLTNSPGTTQLRWLRSRAIVDHIGPHRLALKLGGHDSFRPVLRAVTPEDMPFLFRIANQPSSRAASPNSRTITAEEHFAWGEGFFNGDRRGWIFGSSQLPIGHCRLDGEGSRFFLGYSILEEFQGSGWGEAMLTELFDEFVSGEKVFARVLANNTASLRLLARLGFIQLSAERDLVTLIRDH